VATLEVIGQYCVETQPGPSEEAYGTVTEPPNCVDHRPDWLSDADNAFNALLEQIAWEQRDLTLFGRTVPTPRLTAWMGDAPYTYSGVTNFPLPWPPRLAAIRDVLTAELGVVFNSCLANLYRDGSDSMGWHSDDEPELGPRPTIASLSLGARRVFALRHRQTRERWTYPLGAGDLLIMRDESQAAYAHAVPKTAQAVGPRINLTFREFRPELIGLELRSTRSPRVRTVSSRPHRK
jgi:alkylated DNA repair dioxygenase AlkB